MLRAEPVGGLRLGHPRSGAVPSLRIEISPVAENASTPTARYLTDDAKTLKICQCCVDGRRGQPRARDKVVCGGEWMELEQVVNARRPTRPLPSRNG